MYQPRQETFKIKTVQGTPMQGLAYAVPISLVFWGAIILAIVLR